ncbi:MAG: nucleoside phosphorylase [Bacteroidota bacterium]
MTGIVVGLRAEARLLRGCPLVACAGAEPENAARALLAAGATRLLSFGLAGGLDPALEPGALVLASEIVTAGNRWPTDPAWAADFPPLRRAPLLGAAAPLLDRTAKAAAFRDTGAAAVDLESGAVAAAAAAAGVPLLALRAVADPAAQTVPAAVLKVVNPQGQIRLRAAMVALALHPWAMVRLALQAQAGMTALRSVVQILASSRP